MACKMKGACDHERSRIEALLSSVKPLHSSYSRPSLFNSSPAQRLLSHVRWFDSISVLQLKMVLLLEQRSRLLKVFRHTALFLGSYRVS